MISNLTHFYSTLPFLSFDNHTEPITLSSRSPLRSINIVMQAEIRGNFVPLRFVFYDIPGRSDTHIITTIISL